ncbi:MAG TPA: phosphoribosylanthranilate isomerase [Longimicrobiales bacterium]|nr:phosphoribosylanthranilate isomerase [Longimicrobiales bacterium]
MTQVKVCGVCRARDAAVAASAGAAYVGVILAPQRARTQSAEGAAAIFSASAARRVGVFVDEDVAVMIRHVQQLALDVVQLHGDESTDTARQLAAAGVEVWKAVRVRDADDVLRAARAFHGSAHALLLDGWSPHAHGGTGVRFDWDAVADARAAIPDDMKVIAAGGLDPDNVAAVIRRLAPDAVDVSSGVEEQTGVKSTARIHAFIAAVRGAKDPS